MELFLNGFTIEKVFLMPMNCNTVPMTIMVFIQRCEKMEIVIRNCLMLLNFESVSISNLRTNADWQVYPNPESEALFLKYKSLLDKKIEQVLLFNTLGNLI